MHISVSNTGRFGLTGYRGNGNCDTALYQGTEYPAGSGFFLLSGGLWIGAIRGSDTLVSVSLPAAAFDPVEFFSGPYPEGEMTEKTTLDVLPAQSPNLCPPLYRDEAAVSEHDIVAAFTDTVTDPAIVRGDPYDTRAHVPLGVAVTQKSFAWSSAHAEDFVIIEYHITNIGNNAVRSDAHDSAIRSVYIGVACFNLAFNYVQFAIDHTTGPEVNDDLAGVLVGAPMPGYSDLVDSVFAFWVADNDGEPTGDVFADSAVTAVAGVRLLASPTGSLNYSLNWWNEAYDWGPVRRNSKVDFRRSGFGPPLGDRMKYQMMANTEFEYPQIETALNHEADGWFPPPNRARDIADGIRVISLLTVGPFDLNVGDTAVFAIAIVGGENFHRTPTDFADFFDPNDPQAFLSRLDFSDFASNCQRAAWTYDSPGFDTDGDGYRGDYYVVGEDTIYYRGDGVPDFKGPPPPNPPPMRITTREGEMTLRFNGRRTETDQDAFTHRVDFEGYRLYMSRTGRRQDYAMLTQRDLVNYARYAWNENKQKWEFKDPPYTLDSLKKLYDSLSLLQRGYPFHPDSFDIALVEKALLVEWLDPEDPSILDTFFYYFGPYEGNQSPNDRVLAQTVEAGIPVTNVIRKVYPDAKIEDTLYRDDGTPFLPYYECEYVIDHLQLAEPVFFALTAFDHGDPISGLEPLESSVSLNAQEVWAINSAEVVKSTRPKPGVYPNPYKFSEYYNASGWENPRGLEPDPERARKVTFFNVPDTCVVSIWSIDGDLVRRIEHRENPSNSQASVVIWNLITRNTQAVKTGIYLYSIESRFGVDTGKLVIIK
jgi:hypothetical protein